MDHFCSAMAFSTVTFSTLIIASLVNAGFTSETNYHLGLTQHLMKNYGGGYTRPVKDGTSPTRIAFRCLLGDLIEMNTHRQILTLKADLKMTWKDEFISWNISDWGNITQIHLPAEKVWFPDLTLYNIADRDSAMINTPTNIPVIVNPDGTIVWLSPSVMTTSCRQRVKYFPFDTQVCLLRFTSWTSNSEQIDFYPEEGNDTIQDRFVTDGTWDFINITVERRLFNYPCCSKPFSELFYYVMFRRRPTFYIYSLIVPFALLSVLSVMVFYLPSESGEKLALSVTNLLALVFFQQMMSQTLPPSPDGNPILGTYFFTMIIMVCLSVFFTALIIHIGFNTFEMPSWVEWLFLDYLGNKLFRCKNKEGKGRPKSAEENANDMTGANSRKSSGMQLLQMQNSAGQMEDVGDEDELPMKWKRVAVVADRFLFYLFFAAVCATTVIMMLRIYIETEKDFKEQNQFYFLKYE